MWIALQSSTTHTHTHVVQTMATLILLCVVRLSQSNSRRRLKVENTCAIFEFCCDSSISRSLARSLASGGFCTRLLAHKLPNGGKMRLQFTLDVVVAQRCHLQKASQSVHAHRVECLQLYFAACENITADTGRYSRHTLATPYASSMLAHDIIAGSQSTSRTSG